jgi:hypothetical protein
MSREERAEQFRQMFNKAKDAHDRAREKADGYFQVIKGYVETQTQALRTLTKR